MFANHENIRIESLETCDDFVSFEGNSLRGRIYIIPGPDRINSRGCFSHNLAHNQRIDNHPRNVRVSRRLLTIRVFQCVPSVKEFANISTNVVLNQKLPSWMIEFEPSNIKD